MRDTRMYMYVNVHILVKIPVCGRLFGEVPFPGDIHVQSGARSWFGWTVQGPGPVPDFFSIFFDVHYAYTRMYMYVNVHILVKIPV